LQEQARQSHDRADRKEPPVTANLKHHPINEDLWQQLDAAQQLARENPSSSAPAEVRNRAQSRVTALRTALKKAEEQAQTEAPLSEVEEVVRQVFHHRFPLPPRMKDVVHVLKTAAADADELLRQAQRLAADRP
jgi:ElaB/YqjD/DUF883 family membrane-anchored ribosome-binding protein